MHRICIAPYVPSLSVRLSHAVVLSNETAELMELIFNSKTTLVLSLTILCFKVIRITDIS